jgi:hypothetical protein
MQWPVLSIEYPLSMGVSEDMRHAAEDGRHSHSHSPASMMSPSDSETAALVRSVKPKLRTDHQREVAESLARRIERRAERVPKQQPDVANGDLGRVPDRAGE